MNYDLLVEKIRLLTEKYNLISFGFDSECIYDLGDLSGLLQGIIDKTIPDAGISIVEEYSEDKLRFVATLSNENNTIQIFADTDTDWLPDDFFQQFEAIPEVFETGLRYCSINPVIGLTGQDAWYFCGTEEDLFAARKEGMPIVLPGENPYDTPEYKQFISQSP